MIQKLRIAKKADEKFGEKVHRVAFNTKQEVKEFYEEHKIGIYIGGTLLLSGGAMALDIAKTVMRRKDMRNQDLRIYDRSLDIWWDLRKKLTTEQRLIINDRMKEGEKLGDILKDLNVLRKK